MATIVNNPGTGDSGMGVAGWIVAAVVVIAVVLVALFVWPGYGRGNEVGTDATNIQVEIPTPDMGSGAEDGTL